MDDFNACKFLCIIQCCNILFIREKIIEEIAELKVHAGNLEEGLIQNNPGMPDYLFDFNALTIFSLLSPDSFLYSGVSQPIKAIFPFLSL